MAKKTTTVLPPRPSPPREVGSGGEEVIRREFAGGEQLETGGEPLRGHRSMKEYYLYDSDFRDLGRTGAFAAFLFAAASGCLGFGANAWVGLAFAENVPETVRLEWSLYRNISFGLAVIFFFFAIYLTLSGYNTIEQLKAQTRHGTETYVPLSRFRIAIGALFLVAALGVGIWIGATFFRP